jgi:hypothetical protein
MPPESAPFKSVRNLVIVLGDQLDEQSTAFKDFDPSQDMVWMAEVAEESTHVWSAKQRIAVFLSAMRHFAQALRSKGIPLHYLQLDEPDTSGTLIDAQAQAIERWRPVQLVLTAPGDWRVLQSLRKVARETGVPLDLRDDIHFFSTVREFAAHAKSASNCGWNIGTAPCACSIGSCWKTITKLHWVGSGILMPITASPSASQAHRISGHHCGLSQMPPPPQ